MAKKSLKDLSEAIKKTFTLQNVDKFATNISAPFRAVGEQLGKAATPTARTFVQGAQSFSNIGYSNLNPGIALTKIIAPQKTSNIPLNKPTAGDFGNVVKAGLTGAGMAANPTFGLYGGGFTAGLNSVQNVINNRPVFENTAQSFGQGYQGGAMMAPLIGVSNPFIAKAISPYAGKIGSKVAPAVANMAQGVGLDMATGRPTTPISLALDAVLGARGGAGQFQTAKASRSAKIPNEDKTDFYRMVDILKSNKVTDKNMKRQAADAVGVYIDRYLGKSWVDKNGNNLPKAIKDIQQVFDREYAPMNKTVWGIKGEGDTPKGGGDLLQEARKYKSAEEFVKSFDSYHGTPYEIEGGKLKFGAGKQLKKGGYMGGHFFTNEPDIAKEFSFGGTVYRGSGEIKNKVFDVNANKKLFKDYIGKQFKDSDGNMETFTQSHYDFMFPDGGKADWATVYTDLANEFARKQGKIGIAIDEYAAGKKGITYQLFEDNIPVYTDSQLTDIWNQANTKVATKNETQSALELMSDKDRQVYKQAEAIFDKNMKLSRTEYSPTPKNTTTTPPQGGVRTKATPDDINMIKEALHSGDEQAAKELYSQYDGLPDFQNLKSQVEEEVSRFYEGELGKVEADLEKIRTSNPDDPTNKLISIANRLGKHFKAPGALYKITGNKRTYSTPSGDTLTVGGDKLSALDNLVYATDIDGFSKNIGVLAQKYGGVFTEINAIIKSGGIDGGNYESFKNQFADIIGTRPNYSRPRLSGEGGVGQNPVNLNKTISNQTPEANPLGPVNSSPQSIRISGEIDRTKLTGAQLGMTNEKLIEIREQGSPQTELQQKPQTVQPTTPASPAASVDNSMLKAKETLLGESQIKQSKVPTASPLENIVAKSGGTDVKAKVGLSDYLRTPDRVLNKIGLGREAVQIRKAYDNYLSQLPQEIDKVTQWSKQVPPESNQRIFQFLDGQQIQLNPTEARVAGEIRAYLDEWAKKLKLPDDKKITHYITHIFEKDFIQKEFDDDLAKLIKDRVAGSVYDPFLEQRLGKLGYVEDTWRALDAYVKRATRKFNMDPALESTKEAAKKLEISQYNYVKEYIDRVNMRPTEWDNLMDNTVKQVMGYKFGQRPTAAITRTGRQWVYRGTLGLNPGSALKNLTQGANTYAKLGEKYTLKGYWDIATKGSKELEDVGVLRDNFIQDRTLSATKKFWEKVDKGLFVFFDAAEKINRGAAYYGAKAQGLSKGMDEAQAIEYARNVVRDTQFTFGSVDTPPILQSDVAKLLLQFQSFTLKQAEFLGEMVQKKEYAGLARYALASMAMVATVGKLIGMEPKDMIPTFRFGLPPTLQFPLEVGKAIIGAPDKYGNTPDAQERVENVGKSLLPFVPAGIQIKKTVGGIGDVSRGYSQTSSGLVKYPVNQSVGNYIKGGLFGPYNLPEAREYREKDRQQLSKNQSDLFKLGEKNIYEETMVNRQVNKEKEALKEGKPTGESKKVSDTIYQLSDGSITAKVGNDWKSYDSQEEAQLALDKHEFKKSGKSMQVKGDVVFRISKGGDITATPKIDYDTSMTTQKMENAKKAEDYKGWMELAEKQYQNYLTQMEDPTLDELEQVELQQKIDKLVEDAQKYKSYGGFKKGKKTSISIKKVSTSSKAVTLSKSPSQKPQMIKIAGVPAVKMSKPKNISIKTESKSYPAIKIKPFRNTLTSDSIKLA